MITALRYTEITDDIDESLLSNSRSLTSANNYESRLNTIQNEFNVDIYQHIDKSKDLVIDLTSKNDYPGSIDRLIVSLQEHILSNGYNNVNDFLEENNIKVKPTFAARSGVLGYPIDPAFITSYSYNRSDPVPNVLYWPTQGSTDHDFVTKVWEQFLEMGANSLPLTSHSTTIKSVLSDRTDYDYLDNYLTVQSELGNYPLQMEISYGLHHSWSGNDPFIWADHELAPLIWIRDGVRMFAADHVEVYHTTIPQQILAGGYADMQEMIDANIAALGLPAGAYSSAVRYLHCPGYIGSTYQNMLAKLNEVVKWYSLQTPVAAVHGDHEFHTSSNFGSSRTARACGLVDVPHIGLEECTRCLSATGFENNKNRFGSDIANIIRAQAPQAKIPNWHVFDIGTASRNAAPYWELDRSISPMYSLYQVTYDATTPVSNRTLFYDPVARYEELISIGQSKGHQFWPGAPYNAYIYFTQRMDPLNYKRGYMTDQMMYDICYHLSTKGAKGFAIWPGYSGKDKDPVTYPPGSAAYPISQVMDDSAAIRLIPAMHLAVANYNRHR